MKINFVLSKSEYEKAEAQGIIKALLALADEGTVVTEVTNNYIQPAQTSPGPVENIPNYNQAPPVVDYNQVPVQQTPPQQYNPAPQYNQAPPAQQAPPQQYNPAPVGQPPVGNGPGVEEIRAILTEKVDAGKSQQVTQLFAKYQTDNLTNLNPASYMQFFQEAQAL